MLTETLKFISSNYLEAQQEAFSSHAMGYFIRHTAVNAFRSCISDKFQKLLVEGSAGQSKWAAVPWIAFLDPAVTNSAIRGYYVVYLFSADMRLVYLSMNQGTTAVNEEFKKNAPQVLRERANLFCARVPEYMTHFSNDPIDLASSLRRPIAYKNGHAFGCVYDLTNLPSEQELQDDLDQMLKLYLRLTFRGGLDASIEVEHHATDDIATQITEFRRYRLHRKIDRN